MCFFFKQKTAYEMRISDWSSDVCSSDLRFGARRAGDPIERGARATKAFGNDQRIGIADDPCKLAMRLTAQIPLATIEHGLVEEIGRASCRERVCQSV